VTDNSETIRSGSFVARTTRERLMVALAELSAEQGYVDTTIAQVAARAGTNETTFLSHFASKEECLLAAYDAAVDQAFSAAMRAYGSTPGTWAQATHAALRQLLEFLRDTPALTRLCVVEAYHSGDRVFDRRQRAMDLFTTFLEPGYAEAAEDGPPTRLMSELIAGGVFDIIHKHTLQQRLDQLPLALPAITVLTLSPFVGNDEAARLAEL
jgi:AcrR family transcriptional regulator